MATDLIRRTPHQTTPQPRVCGVAMHSCSPVCLPFESRSRDQNPSPASCSCSCPALRGFTSLGHENSAGPPATNQPNPEEIHPRRAHMCACSPAARPRPTHCARSCLSLRGLQQVQEEETRDQNAPCTSQDHIVYLLHHHVSTSKEPQQLLARHLGVLTGGARFGLAVCDGVKQAAASSCGCETAKLYRSIMHRLLQYIGR